MSEFKLKVIRRGNKLILESIVQISGKDETRLYDVSEALFIEWLNSAYNVSVSSFNSTNRDRVSVEIEHQKVSTLPVLDSLEAHNAVSQAISRFGADTQFDKVEEELAECIVALKHYRDDPNATKYGELLGEIADVYIVFESLKRILTSRNDAFDLALETVQRFKIARLKQRCS